jgi:hypothetical protein
VHNEVLKWHEKQVRMQEQINYIMEIQKGYYDEEHDIGILTEEGRDKI